MAGRANTPRPLTRLCLKDVVFVVSAIPWAAVCTSAFESAKALPQDKKQLVLLMAPSLVLMTFVYMKSPGFTLFMRWPSPASHRALNVSTMLSLFLLSVSLVLAYTEWHLFFHWTFCFALAVIFRVDGLCSWLGSVTNRTSALDILGCVLVFWWRYFLLLYLCVICHALCPVVFTLNEADFPVLVELLWDMYYAFRRTVINALLSALPTLHAHWVCEHPALDSVMGLYGSLLLVLAYILAEFQYGTECLWVAGVMAHYCAQIWIAFSTIYAVAFIPY